MAGDSPSAVRLLLFSLRPGAGAREELCLAHPHVCSVRALSIAGGSPGSPAKPYGMNQTVINDILPVVIPKINLANKLPHPAIDVFGAMGGSSGLECGYGEKVNTPNLCGHKCTAPNEERSNSSGCSLQCDAQSCDPCHPNDQGYTVMAATIMQGMGL